MMVTEAIVGEPVGAQVSYVKTSSHPAKQTARLSSCRKYFSYPGRLVKSETLLMTGRKRLGRFILLEVIARGLGPVGRVQ